MATQPTAYHRFDRLERIKDGARITVIAGFYDLDGVPHYVTTGAGNALQDIYVERQLTQFFRPLEGDPHDDSCPVSCDEHAGP